MTTTIASIVEAKTADLDISAASKALAIEEAVLCFKNYCNRDDVPSKANFLIANLAADLLRGQYKTSSAAAASADVNPAELASISVDDVSLSFDASKRAHVITLDDVVLNYKTQLNSFRKIQWGTGCRLI